MIDPGHPRLSIVRQCELAAISRATFYRRPVGESAETLALMRLIDETFLECPFYGARQGSGANGRILPAMMSAELPEGWAWAS
jgi:hypothetical protein